MIDDSSDEALYCWRTHFVVRSISFALDDYRGPSWIKALQIDSSVTGSADAFQCIAMSVKNSPDRRFELGSALNQYLPQILRMENSIPLQQLELPTFLGAERQYPPDNSAAQAERSQAKQSG